MRYECQTMQTDWPEW